ncbi:MAG: 5-oxoprolinase subunit PxpB [Litorimonas sp.]
MTQLSSSTNLPSISPYGDHALYVHYNSDGFSMAINDAVHTLAARLRSDINWIDIMTGYDSLVVTFDSARLSLDAAKRKIEDIIIRQPQAETVQTQGELIDIPVYYGGEYGPDIDAICHSSGLSQTQVIDAHSAQSYRVCMMGFIPGFAFLSETPQALHHPRHATPRAHVPAGSIGIANWQTGIYGLDSPGGWQIIGRTDLTMFDPSRSPPFLIKTGDRIRFVPA